MADIAHAKTDLKLEKMEKRLSAIYSRAEKTVQKKMADYAKSIDEKSAELLQAYKDAETEDEKQKTKMAYIRFYRKLVKSKEFVSLSANVADDLYKANVEASAYINSQTPSIYALNYNYINAEMAKDIDGFKPQEITDTEAEKYSGYTKQTVDRKKDTDWNKDNLKKSALADAWGQLQIKFEDDTGEPFIYVNVPSMASEFETFDTASSHTISVKKMGEIATPMAEEFLPVASEDNYGAVKKSEIVSAYNFLILVPHDKMVEAIAAFRTGNASIVWNGAKVIEAYYESSDDTIFVTFADEPLNKLIFSNNNGFYNRTLDTRTYRELQGSRVRIVNDNNVYTMLSVKGKSGSETLDIFAERISIGGTYGISTTEMILKSSTSGSTKRFRITVDDTGTLSATEITATS